MNFTKKKKVVIYGIGHNAELFMKYFDYKTLDIVAYVDKYKSGELFNGKKIFSPDALKWLCYDEIFVMPYDDEEIILQLEKICDIERKKIRTCLDIEIEMLISQIDKHKHVLFIDEEDYLEYLYEELKKLDSFTMVEPLYSKYNWNIDVIPCYDNKILIFGIYDYIRFNDDGFFCYIRRKYPYSRMVMVLYDICAGPKGFENIIKNFSVERLKKEFDAVITYHENEAKKYGLVYHMYPYPNRLLLTYKGEKTDIVFVGQAKDRLEMLYKIYQKAEMSGLKCKFWIINVAYNKQLTREGLIYNKRISYIEYLEELNNANCILEICQEGDVTSFRYLESVIHHKKLLLNDHSVKTKKYYNPDNMQVFNSVDEIDFEWIKRPIIDYKYEDDYSPNEFLEFLDKC